MDGSSRDERFSEVGCSKSNVFDSMPCTNVEAIAAPCISIMRLDPNGSAAKRALAPYPARSASTFGFAPVPRRRTSCCSASNQNGAPNSAVMAVTKIPAMAANQSNAVS